MNLFMRVSLISGVVFALATVSSFGAVQSCAGRQGGDRGAATSELMSDGGAYRTVNLTETDYPDLTYAAESAVDAVVYVEVTQKSQYQMMDPFFEYFFGQPQQRDQKGSGSGVIIRSDGYIVTNNHVVANATSVKVTLNSNQVYDATVVGTDSATDVALIKIEAEGLPCLQFGDSDQLRLGEWVLAIGSPLGETLRGTITAGIVSAKGRSMPSNDGKFKIESFIQTDAAVNPGNSGGALVNKKGELVGINTAIVSTTGSYSGYSFAVPVNIVKKIVGDLMDFGEVKRAKLGVSILTVDEQVAKEMKLSAKKGVYIGEVVSGSAADKAGLKKGDVVLGIDSTNVLTSQELQVKVNSFHPGDKAAFRIMRGDEEKVVFVTFLGDVEMTGTVDADGTVSFYGSKIRTADKETLARLGLKSGVQVVSVGEGKLSAAGATEGFIIRYVNGNEVKTADDVIDEAEKSKRAVFIEGVTAHGRSGYFGFGKE